MNIGMPELIVLFVIIVAIFGAGKIPTAAKDIASGVKELRKAASVKDKILK